MALAKKKPAKKRPGKEPAPEPKKRGRPKGVPNKVTGDIKKAISSAFRKVGGVKYLEALADSDPRTFCSLLSKIVPQERDTPAGDAGGGTTIIRLITRVPASPEQPGIMRYSTEEL